MTSEDRTLSPIFTPRPGGVRSSKVCPMCSRPIADHRRDELHVCAEKLRAQLDKARLSGGEWKE